MAATSDARRWRTVGVVAAVALGAAAVCHGLLFTVCVVSGGSMRPTLAPGARVLVLKAGAHLERGDLVVFKNPDAPDDLLVKRVVGLPKEQVGAQGGRLVVGDFIMEEPYVLPGTTAGDLAPSRVPDGCYYLLGDNRAESIDSRAFGAVDGRLVVGKVLCTLWTPGGDT